MTPAFWFGILYVCTLIAACVTLYLVQERGNRERRAQVGGVVADLESERGRRADLESRIGQIAAFRDELLAALPDIVLIHEVTAEGLPGHFLEVNTAACERLGYFRERLLELTPLDIQEAATTTGGAGYSRSELVTLSDRALLERENTYARAKLGQVIEKGHVRSEKTYVTAAGARIPVEVSERVFDYGGRRAILCIAHDVTSRKTTQRALHESEQRFRDVFTSSPIGVAMYDAQHQLLSVNRAALRILGIPDLEEFRKFNMFDSAFIPAHEKADVDKGHSVHFETGIDFDEVRQSFRFISSRRGKGYFEFFINDVGRDEQFNVKGYMVQVMDITDRRRVEDALTASERHLRQAQKMEAMGTLAGGIAHDFNNILTPIIGYAEMALHMMPESDPMREFMKEIAKGSYRAKDLVGQILTFSRRSEPEGRVIHVIPIVKEVLNLLRASTPATIEINRVLKTERDVVMGDPTQIHQVVMNLCTNAIYAMKEKSAGLLEVRMTEFLVSPYAKGEFQTLGPGRYLRLSVKDTGTGIEKAALDRMFEPFFTTKPKGEGTGMGLAAVHGIVQSLKGTLGVDTEVGVGTTFHVVLPLLEIEEASIIEAREAMPTGTESVLFVDDDDSITRMAEKMLSALGYRPVVVGHAAGALKIFQMDPARFKAVITDQVMPGMSGVDLAREILAVRLDVPVILCTSFNDADARLDAEAAGVKEFISKPIMMRELADVLRRALGHAANA